MGPTNNFIILPALKLLEVIGYRYYSMKDTTEDTGPCKLTSEKFFDMAQEIQNLYYFLC